MNRVLQKKRRRKIGKIEKGSEIGKRRQPDAQRVSTCVVYMKRN